MGYKLGGTSGFGLRRMLVDQNGRHKTVLQPGERKSIHTDRVILVPGPEEEIRVVHRIYEMFIEEGKWEGEIARALNAAGILTESGRAWTNHKVHSVLTDEKYIGNNIYHRGSCRLKGKQVKNPPAKWIRAEGVFQRIVEPERFYQAKAIIQRRRVPYSDEELLANLRRLLAERGRLSSSLIKEAEYLPGVTHLIERFGSLLSLYQRLGYQPCLDYSFTKLTRRLLEKHLTWVASLIKEIEKLGATARWHRQTRTLLINNELLVRVLLMRHCVTAFGTTRWYVRLSQDPKPDLILAARMEFGNEGIRDYYLLPGLDPVWQTHSFAEDNGVYLDLYRFSSLDFFLGLLARGKLPEAS